METEEVVCAHCDAEFEITYDPESLMLSVCPFCGEALDDYIEDDDE